MSRMFLRVMEMFHILIVVVNLYNLPKVNCIIKMVFHIIYKNYISVKLIYKKKHFFFEKPQTTLGRKQDILDVLS